MHACTDVAFVKLNNELIAINGKQLRNDTENVKVPAMRGELRNKRRLDSVDLSELLLIAGGNRQTARLHLFHAGKLDKAERGLNVKHVVLIAGFHNVIFPAAALGVAVPGVVAHSLADEDAGALRDIIAIGDEHTAVAGSQIFRGIEAVGGGAAQLVADQTAFVAAPQRMGGVLGYIEVVLVRQFINAVQIADLAAVMHRDDSFCAGGNLLRDLLRIDAAGAIVDVGKDGLCAAVQNGACGGSERHRRGDHFVAGADVLREQGDMQGGGAGVHGNCVLCSKVLGKLFLEFQCAGALGDPA